jgi:hypothetical protein
VGVVVGVRGRGVGGWGCAYLVGGVGAVGGRRGWGCVSPTPSAEVPPDVEGDEAAEDDEHDQVGGPVWFTPTCQRGPHPVRVDPLPWKAGAPRFVGGGVGVRPSPE